MMQDEVHPTEIAYLANRAVKELIDDAASGRVEGYGELAEIVTGCIRDTSLSHLKTLKRGLFQRALERADLTHKRPDYKPPAP